LARSRGRGFPSRGSTSRRRTGWEEGPFTDARLALSAAGATGWSIGQTSLVDGLTIARIRGSFAFFLDTATSDNDGFLSLAVGIGIVTTPAFLVGITAMPSPLTEIEWEGWMYHKLVSGVYRADQVDELGNAGSSEVRVDIDTKAMRKLDSEETVFGAVELGLETGTATGIFSAHTRMLIMLA